MNTLHAIAWLSVYALARAAGAVACAWRGATETRRLRRYYRLTYPLISNEDLAKLSRRKRGGNA